MELHTPTRARRGGCESGRDLVELEPEGQGGGGGRNRVRDLVPPRQSQPHVSLLCRFAVPSLMEVEGVTPVRVTAQSRGPHPFVELLAGGPRQHPRLRTTLHSPDQWIVAIENGPAVSRQALDQLTFRLRDCGLAAELSNMSLADIQHQADSRRRDLTEIGDVA